jgi:hypothetical protein
MSPPEVWHLLDDPDNARLWIAELCGSEREVEAVERRPEQAIVWGAESSDAPRIGFELAEKGWGTQVSVTADAAEDVLEELLDRLAAPERRPFAQT